MLLGRESTRCVRRDAVLISYLEIRWERRKKESSDLPDRVPDSVGAGGISAPEVL
jgi:hypothetical protein